MASPVYKSDNED